MIMQLTRGNPTSFSNLVNYGSPAYDVATAVCEDDDGNTRLVSQVSHQLGTQTAQLSYLVAEADFDQGQLACLLDELVKRAGGWGALNVTCELEANSAFFETFRRCDFNVWSNERFWTIDPAGTALDPDTPKWRTWTGEDAKAMRSLYQNIVPRLFQPIEPMARKSSPGLVLYNTENTLLGYADLLDGPKGTWVLPVLYPQWADDPALLLSLQVALPNKGKRAVHYCVRSYQPWLEDTLTRMGASASQEYVLMVKYMALRQKAGDLLESRVLENGRKETSVPVARIRPKGAS